MRLAKSSVTVIALLALLAWVVADLPAQTKTPAKAPAKSEQAGKKPAAARPAAQAPPRAKPSAKAAPAAKQPAKPAAKAAPLPTLVARRDPFDPLVGRKQPGGELPERLPPGKAGLVISTLRLDGLVRGPNGMIAVVSNPQQRVYFLREGDQLYDGRVERITMDAVAFHEVGKDAFGKPVERQVIKRLYPSPGESR